jgi:hypothetical protein
VPIKNSSASEKGFRPPREIGVLEGITTEFLLREAADPLCLPKTHPRPEGSSSGEAGSLRAGDKLAIQDGVMPSEAKSPKNRPTFAPCQAAVTHVPFCPFR